MPKKSNKNKFDPKIFLVIFVGISGVLAFILGGIFLGSSPNVDVDEVAGKTSVYKNNDYGFEITYPTEGQVIDANGKMTPGKCGATIKPTPISSYNYVLSFDNYFMVTEQDFDGSIAEFINSYPGYNLFNTKPIDVPGANEAVSISKKADATPEDLMKSPFAYTLRIIKKGNEMFMITGLQNYGNPGGCVPANDTARNKVIDTFKFTN